MYISLIKLHILHLRSVFKGFAIVQMPGAAMGLYVLMKNYLKMIEKGNRNQTDVEEQTVTTANNLN